jgi:hypothetical protein
MSIAEMFQSQSSGNLSAVDDPFSGNAPLEVQVSIDMNFNILENLPLLTVPEGYLGKIIWTVPAGTMFDNPGIAFQGPAPFTVFRQDDQTYIAYVNNNNPNQRGLFQYTISVGGHTQDPTVENAPPPD